MCYPEWLQDSLRVVPCMNCGSVVGVGEITMVGGSVSMCVGPFPGFLKLVVETRCWKCRKVQRVEQDRRDSEIVEALAAHLSLADPPQPHGKTTAACVPFDDDEDPPQRPHVRIDARDLFDTPITERDAERWRRLLKRVSMKRDSVSWRAWLRRLRIDPDDTD